MKGKETRNCVVCGRTFNIITTTRGLKRINGITRGINCYTCSKSCSKIYCRGKSSLSKSGQTTK